MRELADAARIRRFMRALGAEADSDAAVYLTGGATAVLLGWRTSTIDIDIRVVPENDRVLRALPGIKDGLAVNVELASPHDFIPVPSGWEGRSLFVAREGRLTFYHFDLYAQALAKVERAHSHDLLDVEAMLERGIVDPVHALAYFEEIEPQLYRYPAVDPESFARRVADAFGSAAG